MKTHVKWPVERVAAESVGLCSKRLGRIGELIGRYVGEGKVSGVITLVARRGKIAHLECVGKMDLERGLEMREDAIFRIYSMTKLVTSVAVLMLMEEGRFILKEPVKKWLPEVEEARVAVMGADGKQELVRPSRDITIHDLLTHLSGMIYDKTDEAREKGWSLAEFVREFVKVPLKHQPGKVWEYGCSTDVLGRLIEVVSGVSFEEFLQARIFGPLGMTDTAFWVPKEKAGRLAQFYEVGENGKLEPTVVLGGGRYLEKPAMPSGGGGLVSTTADYLRFSLALVNGGEFAGVRLLSRKTMELMTEDHLPAGHGVLEINGCGFGLGVSVLNRVSETKRLGTKGEFGWGGAACTQVWIDPAEQMVSMIMLQHRPKDKFPLMDLFKNAAYQAIVG